MLKAVFGTDQWAETELYRYLIRPIIKDVDDFSSLAGAIRLRRYQKEVALAIVDSVIHRRGYSFVIIFPRQSGKNELQAQIEAYLLTLFSKSASAELVKVSPTFKPQTLNAMRRLERVLTRNLLTRSFWSKESGYIYRIGQARMFFFSGSPEANIVGATASTLLEVDEAQDVQISKFDKDIAPMAASTNATRVFWGTAWTSRTLLARELRAALEEQKKDGCQRVFQITADDVAAEVPAYGSFVAQQVARLGRTNPMIRTQYFCEEIDAEGGLFPPQRQALMRGTHPPLNTPQPGAWYAFLLDVAGQDEGASCAPVGSLKTEMSNPGRDSTALTIVEISLESLADPALMAPTYRCVSRCLWTGAKQTAVYAQVKALAELWMPRHLVVDATGIGAGLASFLDKALPGRVIPFTFTAASKSQLAWSFLAIIDSGRWREYAAGAQAGDISTVGAGSEAHLAGFTSAQEYQAEFFHQLDFCQYEIQPGPDHKIKWSVPDGTRDTATGTLVHDDLIMSAALSAELDAQPWAVTGPTLVVQAPDPLEQMDRGF